MVEFAFLSFLCQVLSFWQVEVESITSVFLSYLVLSFVALSLFLFIGDSVREIDGSFYSKFLYFERAINIYSALDTQSIFTGLGLSSGSEFMGVYLHNIYAIFALELGVLPLLLLFVMLQRLFKMSNGYQYPLVVMVVFSGFSLFSPYMPYFFLFSALIVHSEFILSGSELQRRYVVI